MAVEDNKAAIHRLVQGFWIEGNPGVMDEVFAAEFVHRTPGPGIPPNRDGLKQGNIMIRSAFSDSQATIEEVVVEGEKIAWRWTFSGKHTGQLMGIPATGKQIRLSGIVIDSFSGGKIIERWDQTDVLSMMQQLGVIPTPG